MFPTRVVMDVIVASAHELSVQCGGEAGLGFDCAADHGLESSEEGRELQIVQHTATARGVPLEAEPGEVLA